MGGVDITVTTKEKPEQSFLDDYLKMHADMFVKGRLRGRDQPRESLEADVEMRRKAAPDEKFPLEIFGPAWVDGEDDIAPEIVAITPMPYWRINIGCELGTEQNWTDALDLAFFIAKKYKGVVYTSEAGIMWP
jgi:hypothetical protein